MLQAARPPAFGRMAGLPRTRSRQNQFLEDVRTARRAEAVAICSLFIVLLWGACLIPLPAPREFKAGANDSLLYHSLLGRAMGNTMRMRPRDGYGKTYDLSTEHSTAEDKSKGKVPLIVGGPHNRDVPGLTDTRDIADAWMLENDPPAEETVNQAPPNTLEQPPPAEGRISARITVRSTGQKSLETSGGGSRDSTGQEANTLQLRSQVNGAFYPSREEQGQQQQQRGQQQEPVARVLEAGEEVVDDPGAASTEQDAGEGLSRKAALYAASMLQAKAQAATQGENLVDAEMDRIGGANSMKVATQDTLAKAMLAAGISKVHISCVGLLAFLSRGLS